MEFSGGPLGISLAALITGQDDSEGFWTRSKLYGEDGRHRVK